MATHNDTPERHSPKRKISHTQLISEVSNDTLRHYIESRKQIDKDINFLMVFTSLLSQYRDCSGDEVLVDFYSIGYVNQMLHTKVLDIIEELDAFLPLGDAMGAVREDVIEEA